MNRNERAAEVLRLKKEASQYKHNLMDLEKRIRELSKAEVGTAPQSEAGMAVENDTGFLFNTGDPGFLPAEAKLPMSRLARTVVQFLEYYINNPSAWAYRFDQKISDDIERVVNHCKLVIKAAKQ